MPKASLILEDNNGVTTEQSYDLLTDEQGREGGVYGRNVVTGGQPSVAD